MRRFIISFLLFGVITKVLAANGDIFTDKTVEGIELKFTIVSEEDKLCELSGVLKDFEGGITIPEKVRDYTVSVIGNNAFYKCTGLTSVIFPNSIKIIGSAVFSGCSKLTTLDVSNFTQIKYPVWLPCFLGVLN